MPETDRELARQEKTRGQFDAMAQALKQVVDDYNRAEGVASDRIRVIDPSLLRAEEQGKEGRTMALQRRNAFVRLMMGSAGTLQITWGYEVPATGDRVFPEVNRLMLDTDNDWQMYRIKDAEEVHLERFDPEPGRMAKVIVERLIANAAIAPELQPVLAI